MNAPTKILVIRFSSLGDVVLTTPVFQALRQAYPQARIVALTKTAFADVLAKNPNIDECWTLNRHESLRPLLRRVRAERFELIVDLHANVRSRLVCLFARAARVVRYHKAALARRLYVLWGFPSEKLRKHTLERYMDALRRLGIWPEPRSILVIQTAFLGDAVLTTPLLGALHEKYPKAPLTVFCTPEIADIFERHPAVSDVMVYDKRGKDRSWKGMREAAHRLRERRFDLALLPHRSFKSAWFAWRARIPRRIGFSSSQGRRLLTETVPFRWGVHDVERNLALLAPLGGSSSAPELWIRPEPEAGKAVAERLAAAGVGSRTVLLGINAGSLWATKRWLPEGFAAVAERVMEELGARVLFVGGAKDRGVVEEVLRRMRHPPLNWAGETTLRELIAVVARCNAFLTNDSGPMHLAVASGVPTVALFGPTTQELGFFPYGPGHQVIEKDLSCRPCGLHGAEKCPLGHFQCMKLITPDEVFEAVKRKLIPAAASGAA